MKNKHAQDVFKVNDGETDLISIYSFEFPPDEAKSIAELILELVADCNVAKVKTLRSLFETNQDPKYQVIEIDAKVLRDFQALNDTHDFRQSIVDLIEFYASIDTELNVIILADALVGRESYTKFTAQLVQFIKAKQTHYSTVIVEHDIQSGSLGIFCRHSPIHSNKKFLGGLKAALKQHRSFSFDRYDVPASYCANPALIRFLAKRHMGMEVDVQVTEEKVFISRK